MKNEIYKICFAEYTDFIFLYFNRTGCLQNDGITLKYLLELMQNFVFGIMHNAIL